MKQKILFPVPCKFLLLIVPRASVLDLPMQTWLTNVCQALTYSKELKLMSGHIMRLHVGKSLPSCVILIQHSSSHCIYPHVSLPLPHQACTWKDVQQRVAGEIHKIHMVMSASVQFCTYLIHARAPTSVSTNSSCLKSSILVVSPMEHGRTLSAME